MGYMIVNWDENKLTYEILTYSHNYTDLVNQYIRFKKSHPNCIPMINLWALELEEMRINLKAQREEIKCSK